MGNHSKRYNGHKNWQFWNVSLWINNDEGLYRMALGLVECYKNIPMRQGGGKTGAAVSMLGSLQESGKLETPDGAKYSVSAIRAAMECM